MRLPILIAVAAAILGDLLWPMGWTERGLRPDFVLLVVIAAGFLGRRQSGFQVGVVAGFLLAPLTMEPFGLDAALLGACGIVADHLSVYVRTTHTAVQTTVAALLSLVLGLLVLLRIELAAADAETLSLLGPVVLGAACTGLAAPIVLAVMDALSVFGPRGERRMSLV